MLPADSRGMPADWFLFLQQEPTDEDAQPATPADAAQRLVGVLGETRMLDHTGGQQEALGVVVDVNVRVDGLQGKELWVLWQLAGQVKGHDPVWFDEVPAARIEAEKYSDGGLVRFWIPLPEQAGHYAVEVIIEDAQGKMLDGKKSEPFH
jgi:hypothetical protein